MARKFFSEIPKYVDFISGGDLCEIVYAIVHVTIKMKAAQNLIKFVIPDLDEERKKRILGMIVFDQYIEDMRNILDGQKCEKY